MLRLVDGGTYTCGEIEKVARDHVREIRRKVADLRRLQRVLETMAAQCSGDAVPDCPIIDALFDPGTLSQLRASKTDDTSPRAG